MSIAKLFSELRKAGSGGTVIVPETWMQGRTGYGGFSAALALIAAQQVGGEGLPPLRSAAVSFVGPVSGEVQATARVLRKGKNATWIAAELTCGGACVLTVTFVFMGPVKSAIQIAGFTLPEGVILPEAARVFEPHPVMPMFLKHNFDVAFALPRSDDKRAELCWWVRLKDRSALDLMVELLLVADALPPGVMPLLSAATPVSSMTWQANLLTADPVTHDGWWLLRSAADYAENGCSSQQMTLWNSEGAPTISGMQSIAVFG